MFLPDIAKAPDKEWNAYISYKRQDFVFLLAIPRHFYWEQVKFFKKFSTGEEVKGFSICYFFVFIVFCFFFRGKAWAKRGEFFGRS